MLIRHRHILHTKNDRRESVKKRRGRIVFIILILILISVGFQKLENVFRINEITIHKYSGTKKNVIVQSLNKYTNLNYFFINQNRLTSDLQKIDPNIDSIKISKNFPNKISIDIQSKKPFAKVIINKSRVINIENLLNENQSTSSASEITPQDTLSIEEKNNDREYIINQDGLPIENGESNIRIIKKQYENDGIIPIESINNIMHLINGIKSLSFFDGEITLLDNNTYVIRDNSDTYIIFSRQGNMDSQVRSLQVMLNRFTIDGIKPKKIDLRFEKPVIVF